MIAVARKKALCSPSTLVDAHLVGRDRRVALQEVAARYAGGVTPAMADLIDPTDPLDPIARQFVPDARELSKVRRKAAIRSATMRSARSKASSIAIPTGCS